MHTPNGLKQFRCLHAASAQTTIRQLRKLITQFGIPDTLVFDNGSQFTATEFQEFCRLHGIRHTTVAPYHPSSNGLVEEAKGWYNDRQTLSHFVPVQNHPSDYNGPS